MRSILLFFIMLGLIASMPRASQAQHQRLGMEGASPVERGRTLFEWVWEPTTRPVTAGRSDGLGPMFNARSCAECHHQGGTGGSGSAEHNIDIVIARPNTDSRQVLQTAGTSIVLHKQSTDPSFAAFRRRLGDPQQSDRLEISQRNTPSLFGLGLVDKIPDEALLLQAARQKSLGLNGRVSRTADGRVGKFGWKAQTATLRDFIEGAAAGELGLQTPAKHQGSDPRTSAEPAPDTDLSTEQIDSLTAFVNSLARPKIRQEKATKAGARLFEHIDCGGCHVPDLGDVKGLYSDLLLHRMKAEPKESGTYEVFGVSLKKNETTNQAPDPKHAKTRPDEWRTPPLWGVGITAPYMHDGSSPTLQSAITAHGGESETSARKYQRLTPDEKMQLDRFLRSL